MLMTSCMLHAQAVANPHRALHAWFQQAQHAVNTALARRIPQQYVLSSTQPACRLLLQLVQVPPALEQQVLMQFNVGPWSQPLPSQARQQADQLQRLPQESVGLWVPPHPRINNGSLYKLEQRLAKGRPLDMRRIVRALQEQFPDCQQPGELQQLPVTQQLQQ